MFNDYNAKLNPMLPYHERAIRYNDIRKKIFCEHFSFPVTENKLPKRNTLRIRNFWKRVAKSRTFLNFSLKAFENIDNDIRPYIKLEVFGMSLIGLIDTGASITCIAGSAAKSFLEGNIPYKKINEFVTTAGGSKYKVYGYLDTDIEFRDLKRNIKIYIVPDLKNELYLGIDFVRSFEILNLDTGGMEVKELYHNNAGICHNLTPEMSKRLENTIRLLPSYEREGLGRTLLLRHTIELEENSKPVKQRHFSVSPAIGKLIHE